MKAAGVFFGQLFSQWLQQYKHKLSLGKVRELEQVVQQQGGPRVAVVGTELLSGFEGFAEELPETEEEYAASLLAYGYHSAEEAAAAADAGEKLRQGDWYQQYLLIGTPEGPETAELATMPPFMLQQAYLAACKVAYAELSIGEVGKAACLESGTMSAAAASVEPSKLILQEVPDCTQPDRDQQPAAVADEQKQQQECQQQQDDHHPVAAAPRAGRAISSCSSGYGRFGGDEGLSKASRRRAAITAAAATAAAAATL